MEKYAGTSKKAFIDSGLRSPLEVAQKCVQKTMDLKGNGNIAVLAMGEHHTMFSHQITQALTLKEFIAQGQNITLFMEYPHNRLYTILLDRGYSADNASKLAERITALDADGHIMAQAIIGGNNSSLRGLAFTGLESQMLLQTAMLHRVKIVYADAARVFPDDFCMDFSDPSTNAIALKLNARRGPEGENGTDDMLIRNTHMAEIINIELQKSGGIGLLPTGSAHCLGIDDKCNGLHYYRDSLSERFRELSLPAVLLSMTPAETLPADYQPSDSGQIHLFEKPGPLTLINDLSNADIRNLLINNGLDPDHYDPRNFAENYKKEFDRVLMRASMHLGIQTPSMQQTVQSLPTPPASCTQLSGRREFTR